MNSETGKYKASTVGVNKMDFFKSFEQLFKPFNEAQSMFLNSWESTMSNMRSMNSNFSENVEKAVQLQEDLVRSSLELQQQIGKFSIETQTKLWDSYFKMVRK
jgi:hypothetical protein